MKYVGIQTQIDENNRKSILLLLAFPCIMLGMLWVFFALITGFSGSSYYDEYGQAAFDATEANALWLHYMPYVVAGVGIWFVIAYFLNTSMIQHATGARPLTRRENPRVYNIVENLCIAGGMDMPKINVVDDPQLNAFASGISKDTYTVTVTTGICDYLTDEELAGVIGHELTHIRNNDTKLLVVSIVFVGIVSTILSMLMTTGRICPSFSTMSCAEDALKLCRMPIKNWRLRQSSMPAPLSWRPSERYLFPRRCTRNARGLQGLSRGKFPASADRRICSTTKLSSGKRGVLP